LTADEQVKQAGQEVCVSVPSRIARGQSHSDRIITSSLNSEQAKFINQTQVINQAQVINQIRFINQPEAKSTQSRSSFAQ